LGFPDRRTIALIQPWAIALWRKAFRPGTIDIHEAGTIEVGYSAFGPTIGLRGTLRAVHRDQFVREIALTVVKQKDRSRHTFNWFVFRAEKLTAAGTEDSSYEVAAGFILLTTQPYRYSILFADYATRDEMKPHIESLQAGWNSYTRQAADTVVRRGTAASVASIGHAVAQSPDTFGEFAKTQISVDTYGVMERRLYWEAGTYALEMNVRTTRPENNFQRRWKFHLTEADFQNLRLNAVAIMGAACSQSDPVFNWAYPHYQSE
jgi:hypothetical protein